jgi:hypothetical protein
MLDGCSLEMMEWYTSNGVKNAQYKIVRKFIFSFFKKGTMSLPTRMTKYFLIPKFTPMIDNR